MSRELFNEESYRQFTENLKPLLKGPNFVLLRNYVARQSARLLVPSLVVRETVNHYRERLARHVRSVQSELRSVERLMTSDKGLPQFALNEEECVEEFRAYLEKRIKWLGGEVVAFDNVTVEALLSRALERRKPFDGEGKKAF